MRKLHGKVSRSLASMLLEGAYASLTFVRRDDKREAA